MPMERERHEEILNLLNDPEIETSKRNDLLNELRGDYGTVITDYTDLTTTNEKLKTDNEDLSVANSKMFRDLGYTTLDEETKNKQVEEEKAKSITITDLVNTANENYRKQPV